MPRPVPNLSDRLEEVCEPGERVLASSWAMLRPPLARAGYALGWIGVYTIGRPAARRAAAALTATSRVPLGGTMVLALTDRRLLIWAGNIRFGRVEDFLGSVPRERIRDLEAVTVGRSQQLRVVLTDSDAVTLETPSDAEDMTLEFRSSQSSNASQPDQTRRPSPT